MFTLEPYIDLPLVWGCLIATAVLLYVVLDGFDLGVGILFPFAPSDKCRDRMINSIAPFWDGNETWLVLGGGGMFAAFPLAYALNMPAFYIPIILMLFCLIFRGVAFEFRYKAENKRIWDYVFHFGSLGTAFMQGLILGGFIQGVEVEGRSFVGGAFDWLTGFSMLTGIAVVFGYALLGATWLNMKTEDETQNWALKCSKYVSIYVIGCMAIVSLWVPFLNDQLLNRWFSLPNFYYLLPIPIVTGLSFLLLWHSLSKANEIKPFLLSLLIFFLGYLGLAISLWPWIVPYQVSLWDAAAAPESQSLLLVGTAIMLPIILGYTAYCYYIFRGKTHHEDTY